MKYVNIFVIIITEIILLVHSEKSDKFLPNLPIGEYRLKYKSILKCDLNPNSEIQQNFYLTKISINTTALKGNLTLKKPFDDSFTSIMNFAIKDSIGGWKENAHVFRIAKACSSYKHFFGPVWKQMCSSLGLKSFDCPIQPGVYMMNNLILPSSVTGTFLPQSFFYGTYKMRVYYTDNSNIQHGCLAYVIEVKRPWEMD